jgi:hypothetical protein
MYGFMHIILVLLYHVYITKIYKKMFYSGKSLEILNGLIQFALFLTGKFNSKVEQIESRTASWNGMCSSFEGPLYIYIYIYVCVCVCVCV